MSMAKVNLIDKLRETDMLYYVLVSLFSADTLVDVESCQQSLKGLEILKTDLETSKLKDDVQIKTFMEDAERIIKRDLQYFEELEKNKNDKDN